MRFAHEVIVVSETMRAYLAERYARAGRAMVIRNGVEPQTEEMGPGDEAAANGVLQRFGLAAGRYVLLVGRIVPEKGVDVLIEAFRRLGDSSMKLVIAGSSDHATVYSERVRQAARQTPGVVLTGLADRAMLDALYRGAELFVLPSRHEGSPIALLGALSYGLRVLCSDIAANREIGLSKDRYVPCGDAEALARRMRVEIAAGPLGAAERGAQAAWLRRRFNWDSVATMTAAAYNRAMGLGAAEVFPKRAWEIGWPLTPGRSGDD